MAKHQIDELSLKIDIKVKKDIDKTISSLARAITRLNNAVADVSSLNKYSKAIGKLVVNSAKVPSATAVGKAITQKDVPTKLQQVEIPDDSGIKDVVTYSAIAKKKVDNLKVSMNSLGLQFSSSKKDAEQFKLEINSTGKSIDNAGKRAKKSASFFGKFVKSIGRIALYRAIRASLSAIVKATEEGFKNFVQFDEASNKAMSNVSNSIGQLKNTLGVSLGNILQTLEPVIVTLSDSLTNLLDNFNMAMASISGKSTYQKAIKQNKDYADSLDETANKLLSFDKFEALNSGDENDPSKMFEEVEMPETLTGTAEIFKEIFEIVKTLFGAVKKLVQAFMPIIETIGKPLLDIFLKVTELLSPIIDIVAIILDYISPIFDMIGQSFEFIADSLDFVVGAFKIIASLFKLLSGDVDGFLHDMANGFADMINSIVNMFIDMINFMIEGLNMLLKPIDAVAGWFGGNVEIPTISWRMNWQPYADGGEFSKGTAFIAGEAGAEIVYNSRTGGGGGVANIEQISEAQYRGTFRALNDYGAARGDLSDLNGMAVIIDGRVVGKVVEGAVYNEGVRVGHFKRI